MDSTSTTGGAKTGLTFSSSGLIISTIADNEAAPTVYTAAGSTIETITTLGTFAAPTATKCRFKEVDATNHPGLYEIQIADARWAVSNARSVIVSVSGATGAAQVDAEVQLVTDDPYTAKPTNYASLSIDGSGRVDIGKLLGTAWLTPAVAGTPDVNAKQLGGTAQTGRDVGASVLISSGAGTGQLDVTSGVIKANLAQILGTALTETAGQIAAAFKKFFNIATPAATMDHGVLVDTITTYTGNTPQTGDNFIRLGVPAGVSIAADIAEIEVETDDIAAVKAKTDNLPTSPAAVGSAMTLTSGERNSIADALLDRADAIETGLTVRQAQRLIAAAAAGKLSGAATTTITIRNAVADSKTRITATVDSSGNRSAITADVS